MKAVIYARYSSDNQREESIDGQLRECRDFAEYNDIEIVGTYIDRALSAKTDDRPAFQRMIQDSYRAIFDIIVVWKLDRFSRDRYDSAHYKALLKKNNVKVISATEQISNNPEGILLESLLEGYAEYYSAELSVKVKRGMTENALKGKWNGGSVPLGYVVGKDQKLEIEPVTAEVVKLIFQMAYDGKTVKEIHRYVEEHNITRPNGKPLRYNAVRYILSNRVYIGEYHHSDHIIENCVPAIIERHIFDSVQNELKKNAKAPARHTAEDDYLLTTKLFCGKCGAMMVAQAGTSHMGNVYRYYACVRQKKHLCDKKMLPKEKLENFVVFKTMELLQEDSVINELATLLYKIQDNESSLLPVLEQQLHEKEKEISNIVSAIRQGVASQTLMNCLNDIEKEKCDIENSIAKERIKTPSYSEDEYKMALTNYRKININTQEGKRKIIDTFINAIYVFDDHLKIIYNGKNKEECVSLEALEGSNLVSSGAPYEKLHFERSKCSFFIWCGCLHTVL
ncbi:Transposase and inactivated derivatives [Anaerotruncus sp. 2789STDY5834896]|uniref:Transposase and inactivated derivatives n=1 Tax=uncultured Anaerotruncus sp. TaxID=905011 RepID=A0A1C6JK07_9FIRM|nr:Transposase and inactivated derivatives [uncultured Anaerotruncus sp.]